MNFTIIKFLEDRLKSHNVLFEFGSGASTLFYARLVKQVVSIEYDQSWFSLIKNRVPENATVLFREENYDGSYCRSIKETDQLYDVVIVDGRDRVNCVIQSLDSLSDEGVVLLDDSQREQYQEALVYAKKGGFRELPLEGMKPTGVGFDRTSILYRDGNCLGI